MNASDFKDYLLADEERLTKLLESLGCHSIWRTGDEIRCAPPDSTNKTAICVKLVKGLSTQYYRSSNTFSGDIIGLIETMQGVGFKDAMNYGLSLFNLSRSYNPIKKVNDKLAFFKSVRSSHTTVKDLDDVEITTYPLTKLNQFIDGLHINLFYEGILEDTAKLFKLGVDDKRNRIIFPHFAYNTTDRIVGITGRTLYSKEDIENFSIAKYWNYIKGYKKMFNLYGFSHAIEHIINRKMLIIFEAEKSVLKHFTQEKNKGFSCAVGGHEISDQQVQIIARNVPQDVEIVVAFDKDIMKQKVFDKNGKETDELFLESVCKKFPKQYKVSYITDDDDLIGEKDSPIDKGYTVFHKLLDNRTEYVGERII